MTTLGMVEMALDLLTLIAGVTWLVLIHRQQRGIRDLTRRLESLETSNATKGSDVTRRAWSVAAENEELREEITRLRGAS